MVEMTVKQMAKIVERSVETLLIQMQEAGLPARSADSLIYDAEKKQLVDYLKSKPIMNKKQQKPIPTGRPPVQQPARKLSALANKLLQENLPDIQPETVNAVEQSIELTNNVENLLNELEKLKRQAQEQSVAVNNERLKLEQEQKEFQTKLLIFNIKKQKLTADKDEYLKLFTELQEQQDNLLELEQKAKFGFVQEKQAALEEKRLELEKCDQDYFQQIKNRFVKVEQLEKELNTKAELIIEQEAKANAGFIDLKNQHRVEIDNYRQVQQSQLLAEKEVLEKEKDELEKERTQIKSEWAQIALQKQRQSSWEQAKADDLKQEYEYQLLNLKQDVDREKRAKERVFQELTDNNKKLAQLADLERQLEGANINSVQEELESSRRTIRDLNAKLKEYRTDGLLEENEKLSDQVLQMEDEVNSLREEIAQKSAELHQNRMNVQDKYNLTQTNRKLKTHNDTLDASIKQMEIRVQDLVESQQGMTPFPALTMMDQRHLHPAANLQPVPLKLSDFVKDLQIGLAAQKLIYQPKDLRLFLAGLSMSNLHILQGMSGTGKTSLARAFAKVINGGDEKQHCEVVRVQAGWRDRDDLLGHFNAFEKKFYEKETLKALYRAQQPAFKDTVQIIVLDEMNLSQPEQYFAEFLSAMETSDRSEIELITHSIANAPIFFDTKEGCKIRIPQNVWFIGTANHDETTKEFADKTYDRAHVMELGRGDDKSPDTSNYQPKRYSYSTLVQRFEAACQKDEEKIVELLSTLAVSELATILTDKFKVGWGERLVRNAKRFIPVLVAAGGTFEEGLDHLLATKLFRVGKVTGRYNTSVEDLELVKEALIKTWGDLKLKEKPTSCIKQINDDITRIGRGI